MNSKFMYFLAFSAGAAVGVAASWRILKTKYAQLAQEEIDSVKEVFSANNKAEEPKSEPKQEKEQYEQIVADYAGEKKENEDESEPYIIHPNQLGDIDEYETTSLYYFADGVLTTLNDEVIEDPEAMVGLDFKNHFGEFEDDSVCVRNDEHKCDYEILKDSRRYADVKKPIRPRETEG